MGSSSENFCLRWNDFETNVSGAFRDLRAESDFFDVTLVCEDNPGKTLRAHKVMLSACSSYFKQMLKNLSFLSPNNPNPLIFLRGMRVCDLESVLDFIYHGEVNVAQSDLNLFLEVAEDLQIKGLTQQSSKHQQQSQIHKRRILNSSQNPPPKRSKPSSVVHQDVGHEVKREPMASSSTSETVNDDEFDDSKASIIHPDQTEEFEDTYEDSFGGYEEVGSGGIEGRSVLVSEQDSTKGLNNCDENEASDKYKGIVDLPDGRCQCLECGKIFTIKGSATRHLGLVHRQSKIQHSCHICESVFSCKLYLNNHLRTTHNIFQRNLPKNM